MVWPAIIAGGASIAGGLLAKKGSDKATKKAIKLQEEMWRTGEQQRTPYRNIGRSGLRGLESLLSGGTVGVQGAPSGVALPGTTGLTGGSERFIKELEDLSKGFKVDPSDPMYQFRLGEAQKQIDQFTASRGNFNSRAAMDALLKSRMQLSGEESEKQYKRKYGSIMDLFGMTGQTSDTIYNKLMGLTNIGQQAVGAGTSAGLATGQGIASQYMQQGRNEQDLWSGIGASPLNFMLLQQLFKKQPPGTGTTTAPGPFAALGRSRSY